MQRPPEEGGWPGSPGRGRGSSWRDAPCWSPREEGSRLQRAEAWHQLSGRSPSQPASRPPYNASCTLCRRGAFIYLGEVLQAPPLERDGGAPLPGTEVLSCSGVSQPHCPTPTHGVPCLFLPPSAAPLGFFSAPCCPEPLGVGRGRGDACVSIPHPHPGPQNPFSDSPRVGVLAFSPSPKMRLGGSPRLPRAGFSLWTPQPLA